MHKPGLWKFLYMTTEEYKTKEITDTLLFVGISK